MCSCLRISTLCGAGNEIGAATGAVLALGLTFFKVGCNIYIQTSTPATCRPVLTHSTLPHAVIVSFRPCAASPALRRNVLLATESTPCGQLHMTSCHCSPSPTHFPYITAVLVNSGRLHFIQFVACSVTPISSQLHSARPTSTPPRNTAQTHNWTFNISQK